MYINTNCYVQTIAMCITLNEIVSDTKIYLKNYSLIKIMYLLIRFKKTKSFLWSTKRIDRNDINEPNTQTEHREKDH